MPDDPYDINPLFAPATSARITQTRFSTARAMSVALASCTNRMFARAASRALFVGTKRSRTPCAAMAAAGLRKVES